MANILQVSVARGPKNKIAATRILAEINGKTYDYPMLPASGTDYNKARLLKVPIYSIAYQHHYNVHQKRQYGIDTKKGRKNLEIIFTRNVKKFNPKITDINLYHGNTILNQSQIDGFLMVQKDLNTTFLSGVEPNIFQSVQDLNTQLTRLNVLAQNQIPSPTISLKIPKALLIDKLNTIHSRGYTRFSIEWTGFNNLANWNTLSDFLTKHEILCNMVAINLPRHPHPPYTSNVAQTLPFGMHSCGIGYQGIPHKPDPSYKNCGYLFNRSTFYYNKMHKNADKCHIESFNRLKTLTNDFRDAIINKTTSSLVPAAIANKIDY